jgi:hypothetical protein
MIAEMEQKRSGRLRAPRQNRAVVVHPAWDRVDDLVQENLSIRARPDYDFQGRKLSTLMRQARSELLDAARRWTGAYRDLGPAPEKTPDLIFLAGHQPQMFHPGVWLKNFALGRLAQRHNAAAVNLIVDSDAISAVSLRVPGGTAHKPSSTQVAFDRPDPAVPYEERRIEDRELFDSFGRRVKEQMAGLVAHPLIEKYWPMAIEQSRHAGRLGASLARARHLIESQWGLETLEIPQSWVCDLDAFHWFVAHLLARLGEFSAVYNEAVHQYRRQYRIRSTSHPVPDLARQDQWLEAPFWIWSADDPRRKRLFAKLAREEVAITDRHGFNATLPLAEQGNAARAVEQLADLARRGVKIRSRALITTLWARLALGDLFMHGIGGGNYDLVTDRIIERFFRRTPPGFMVLSATLHLPINLPGTVPISRAPPRSGGRQKWDCPLSPAEIDRQLRELTYHPERFLDGVFQPAAGVPGEVRELVNTKRRWIDTPQTVENAKTRCRAIRGLNESLQPWLENLRKELLDRRAQAARQEQADRILLCREYGFCLYPEETLRDFIETLLPH